jgi:predicted ATPase
MIEQLAIDGYKSIRHQLIVLKQMNVLAGLNSSGKSSVIQALRILGRVAQKKEDLFPENCGDEDRLRNVHEERMELAASYGEDGEKWIRYSERESSNADFPKIIYVGADRLGPQTIYPSKKNGGLDERGTNVLRIIEECGTAGVVLPDNMLNDQCEGEAFKYVVQGWLKEISPGVRFNFDRVAGQEAHTATYNEFWPTNVGYGLSYTLPVIVAILLGVTEKNGIVLLENPEAHIHAKGQVALADLMCRAVDAGAQIVVETHSDHVFDGVRIYAKEHEGFADKVKLAWFRLNDEESTEIEHPVLQPNGGLNYWPKDMFSQFMDNAERLF